CHRVSPRLKIETWGTRFRDSFQTWAPRPVFPPSQILWVFLLGECLVFGSIGAGGGVDGEVEELFLEVFGGGGEGLAAGGGGDDGEQLELGEGGAGDIEALGVGAGVGGGEEEA